MSQHTPWSQEEAEKWADEYVSGWWAEPLVQARARVDFKAGLAKAAEVIAKSPTMYGSHVGDPINRYWEGTRASCDTHEAKLVGVREVEK